eukprot:PLAT212.14.p1 GENE.PLAT212.14~~PLAT212.14.p1  ORF type:complete len:376 (-),score=192.37 PLAT212.14:236-1363(-)
MVQLASALCAALLAATAVAAVKTSQFGAAGVLVETRSVGGTFYVGHGPHWTTSSFAPVRGGSHAAPTRAAQGGAVANMSETFVFAFEELRNYVQGSPLAGPGNGFTAFEQLPFQLGEVSSSSSVLGVPAVTLSCNATVEQAGELAASPPSHLSVSLAVLREDANVQLPADGAHLALRGGSVVMHVRSSGWTFGRASSVMLKMRVTPAHGGDVDVHEATNASPLLIFPHDGRAWLLLPAAAERDGEIDAAVRLNVTTAADGKAGDVLLQMWLPAYSNSLSYMVIFGPHPFGTAPQPATIAGLPAWILVSTLLILTVMLLMVGFMVVQRSRRVEEASAPLLKKRRRKPLRSPFAPRLQAAKSDVSAFSPRSPLKLSY